MPKLTEDGTSTPEAITTAGDYWIDRIDNVPNPGRVYLQVQPTGASAYRTRVDFTEDRAELVYLPVGNIRYELIGSGGTVDTDMNRVAKA